MFRREGEYDRVVISQAEPENCNNKNLKTAQALCNQLLGAMVL